MFIKFLKLKKEAVMPKYAHPGDAGLDVYSMEKVTLRPGQQHTFWLGFALELPKGYVALVWDKGGIAHKYGIHTIGGVLDSCYRGEVIVIAINLSKKTYTFNKGDKVAQYLIQKVETVKLKVVDKLSDSTRGEGRFGSSGKK